MGYRPEPKLGAAPIVFLLIVLSVWFGIGYFEDTKPHNEHIKKETTKILDNAHKESINSLDTVNFLRFLVDTESASKDSVRLAKEMQKWMKQQGENPRFCDYKEVFDSVGTRNGQTLFRRSKYPWRINLDKAMQDQDFAQIYNQYCQTIKQLKIVRRQNNYRNK